MKFNLISFLYFLNENIIILWAPIASEWSCFVSLSLSHIADIYISDACVEIEAQECVDAPAAIRFEFDWIRFNFSFLSTNICF